eukprot:GHVU01000831.1.p1 GENE.GHVU01000831.1~~GHVU01000831.1.p1  ORF type:complete len:165 (-),score=18.96 GHVU01000831.1:64-558(-)
MTNESTFATTLISALRYHDSLNAQMIGASLKDFRSSIYMKLGAGEDEVKKENEENISPWTRVTAYGNREFKIDERGFSSTDRRQVIVVKTSCVFVGKDGESNKFTEATGAEDLSSRFVGDWKLDELFLKSYGPKSLHEIKADIWHKIAKYKDLSTPTLGKVARR